MHISFYLIKVLTAANLGGSESLTHFQHNSQQASVRHRQPKLNIREPLNYKDLYGNTTDLCKMVETNIVLSIKST